MTLQEKSELVRLLNLYQADLLNLNRKNIENGKTEYFVHGVKAQYEHARIISTKQAARRIISWLRSPLETSMSGFSPQKRGTENDDTRKTENWCEGL